MIATTMLRRTAPRLVRDVLARQGGGVLGSQVTQNMMAANAPITHHLYPRAFSTLDPTAIVVEPSNLTKKVRVLNIDVIKNILQELNTVDVNHDGR